MEEHRKYPRIEDKLVVRCRFSDGSDMQTAGVIKNISLGGIQVFIPTRVIKGVLLGLDIWILADSIPLEAEGRVVWVKQGSPLPDDPDAPQYIVGIEFSRLDEAQKERLAGYLKRRARRPW